MSIFNRKFNRNRFVRKGIEKMVLEVEMDDIEKCYLTIELKNGYRITDNNIDSIKQFINQLN